MTIETKPKRTGEKSNERNKDRGMKEREIDKRTYYRANLEQS